MVECFKSRGSLQGAIMLLQAAQALVSQCCCSFGHWSSACVRVWPVPCCKLQGWGCSRNTCSLGACSIVPAVIACGWPARALFAGWTGDAQQGCQRDTSLLSLMPVLKQGQMAFSQGSWLRHRGSRAAAETWTAHLCSCRSSLLVHSLHAHSALLQAAQGLERQSCKAAEAK